MGIIQNKWDIGFYFLPALCQGYLWNINVAQNLLLKQILYYGEYRKREV